MSSTPVPTGTIRERLARVARQRREAGLDEDADAGAPRVYPKAQPWWSFTRRLSRRTLIALASIVVVLAAARLAAPYAIQYYVNRVLSEQPVYTGHVGNVHLALWRGAYRLDGLRILKREHGTTMPFFSADQIDISVQWAALLHGSVVAELELERPVINFSAEQNGSEGNWRELVDDLVPITINRLAVHDGEVHYRDPNRRPRVDVHADHLEIVARNLSTMETEDERLPARIHVDGRVQSSGALNVDMRLDPLDEQPTFDLALQLRRLPVPRLNRFLRAYAGIDAHAGMFFLYSEIHARHGSFTGYVKPMVEHLELFDPSRGLLNELGDALVQFVTEIFRNQPEDRLALDIPVSGSFQRPGIDGWAAVISALKNAFIQALRHGLDQREDWQPVPARARR